MSERETARPVQPPATVSAVPASPAPADPHPEQVGLLVLDTVTGRVVAANPAARRRLGGVPGDRLAGWLSDLATAAGHRDDATVRIWTGPAAGDRAGRLRTVSAPVQFRSRPCLLVMLRDDATAPAPLPDGAGDGAPAVDHGCAAFTLDPLGRVDSWGTTPQRLFGHRAGQVLGADATLLLPPPARSGGDHHRALLHAYRTGEHRGEGWRLGDGGRLLWAEVTLAPLYDATDRLLGFAEVVHDLTPVRRLQARPAPARRPGATLDLRGLPGQRPAAVPTVPAGPPVPSPARTAGGARRGATRIPAQRRPPTASPGRA